MSKKLIYRFGDFYSQSFCNNILNEWKKFENVHISKKNNLLKIRLKNKLRMIKNIFINPNDSQYKFPRFSKSELNKVFTKLKKCDERYNKVNFELSGPKLVRLKLN